MNKKHPINRGFIKSNFHNVYFEAYGNPNGNPWFFCHGGPGYHCVPESNLKNFNLKKDFVVLFDQRGSGNSQPSCELKENTTWYLIKDILKIMEYFKLEKINLYGGSWGATLALVFAISHPDKVNSLVLRGVFLGRKKDIMEIYSPKKSWTENQKEKYSLTLGFLKKKYKIKNFFKTGLSLLKKKNHLIKYQSKAKEFTKRWAAYEDLICSKEWKFLDFDNEYLKMAENITTIELHYFKNNCFLPSNFILKNANKINCKLAIIHGKEDMVCPVYQAYSLHSKLKKSVLEIDDQGGHSSSKEMNLNIKKYIRLFGKIKN